MPKITGIVLRAWRESVGWDVPRMARELRQAAGGEPLPPHDALVRMIRRWEREDSGVSERYVLLYRQAVVGHAAVVIPRPADVLAAITTADLAAGQRNRPELAGIKTEDELAYAAEQAAFGRPSPVTGQVISGGVDLRLIQQIEHATSVFRSWDNQHGGGLRRKAVIGQLNEVSQLLGGPFPSEHAARRLHAAIADLAQLAGWMSSDLQMHATAQRYYLLGLSLAREAGDRTQITRLLYCLARQMVDLGRPKDALDLAAAGAYAIRRQPAPRAAALIRIAEARAYACIGDERDCRVALGAAQDWYSRAGNGTDPAWCAFFDEGELCGLVGVTLRDLAICDPEHSHGIAVEARTWIERAIAGRSSAFLRSKVLDIDGLAVTSLLLGEPDRAAELASSAISLGHQVSSPRTSEKLNRTLRLGQQQFPDAAPWADLRDQVKALPHGQASV